MTVMNTTTVQKTINNPHSHFAIKTDKIQIYNANVKCFVLHLQQINMIAPWHKQIITPENYAPQSVIQIFRPIINMK